MRQRRQRRRRWAGRTEARHRRPIRVTEAADEESSRLHDKADASQSPDGAVGRGAGQQISRNFRWKLLSKRQVIPRANKYK